MNKLLKPEYRLSEKPFYMQNEDPMLLAIEDLVSFGFRMVDRLSSLDLDHSILEPKQKEMYSLGIFNKQQSSRIKDIFIKSTKDLANEIALWPEVNNMLFRYDNDGKLIDHYVCKYHHVIKNHVLPLNIDFQLCVYSTPALDLIYFLNTSPSLDVMENKKNILLNEYLDILSATMKQLNCKTQPSTIELKVIIKRKAMKFLVVLLFVLCSKTEAKDLDELLSTDINLGIKSENYRKLIIKRLSLYDKWGLLDL
ncbi:PREDICTED: uncharacterized protein LOC105151467 [Acromyrmex echinatior]|uniref:uncharacterized protein LOC105151467 n=1 Tax=Acromyrmex echinatior TaxID=103372 RepID=UPI000580CD0F|nr:PREDICTED: uncharacterized protein LOC105151467 [Acromyrmex echinatior]